MEIPKQWWAMKRTKQEAEEEGDAIYFNPEWRCMTKKHVSPQYVNRGRCWVCSSTRVRKSTKKKFVGGEFKKNELHWPWIPKKAKPEMIEEVLKVQDKRRHFNCRWYMWCLAYSWRNCTRTKSWVCSKKCTLAPSKDDNHQVGFFHRPFSYLPLIDIEVNNRRLESNTLDPFKIYGRSQLVKKKKRAKK